MVHSCEEDVCNVHTIGLSAFLGISFHSLIEGMSMGAGFLMKDIGIIIFLAIIVHKFPSALSLTGILMHGDTKKQNNTTCFNLFIDDTYRRSNFFFYIEKPA